MAYTAQPAYMWYTYSSINTRRSIFNDNQIHSAQVPQSDIWCLFHHSHFCLPYDPVIGVLMLASLLPLRSSEQRLVAKGWSINKKLNLANCRKVCQSKKMCQKKWCIFWSFLVIASKERSAFSVEGDRFLHFFTKAGCFADTAFR